jgi:iron(III) transport system substrate-binding protein
MRGSRSTIKFCGSLLIACLAVMSCSQDKAASNQGSATVQPLILYSSLPEERVRAVTAAYTESSGIAMHYMLDSAPGLIEKLVTKAHRPTADVLLIADAGQLAAAADADVLRPIRAESMQTRIPVALRDPDHYWFGLSVRAVTIVYDPGSVDPARLGSYASLADEEWFGRICLLRSTAQSSHTLIASLIAVLGVRDAELVVRQWRKNLARPLFSNARDLLLALEAGHCEVGIVASDAIAEFVAEQQAALIAMHWPSADDGGALLNLTGAGVTRHASNPQQAVAFLEWLATEDGQRILRASGRDYPANPQVAPAFPFDTSPIQSARLGYLLPDVLRLVERARYR